MDTERCGSTSMFETKPFLRLTFRFEPTFPNQRGVTLLEALIVVVIASIILTLGVPSFRTSIASNRLTSVANAFVSSYNSARLTAIRKNAAVQFCSNASAANGTTAPLGTSCNGAAAGAAFRVEPGGTTATQIVEAPNLPPGITINSAGALLFNGQGFGRAAVGGTAPYTGLLLDLSSSAITTNNRRCLYLTTGSILSVCTVTGSGACNASEPTSCQQ